MDSVNTQDKASAVFKTAILMSYFFLQQNLRCGHLRFVTAFRSWCLLPVIFETSGFLMLLKRTGL